MAVPYIVKTVSQDLCGAIDRLFPDEIGYGQNDFKNADLDTTIPSPSEALGQRVDSKHSGYVQAINNDRLLEIASEHDLVINVLLRPGNFVVVGAEIASIVPSDRCSPELINSVSETFVIGRERTSSQDVEFAVSQLVEVAFRALSPGINDPFTAVSCIDWLTVGLCQLAGRELPSERRFDSDGQLRVIANSVSFAGVANITFNQIRDAGRATPLISIRLLEAIAATAERTQRSEDIQTLRTHSQLIWESAQELSVVGSDRVKLERVFNDATRILNEKSLATL